MGVGRRMPEAKQRALLGHEVAHKVTRDVYCKRGKRCTYTGEHDHRFYKVSDKIHRHIRTNRRAARELESGSGYNPPAGWLRPKRRTVKRRSITGLRRW